MPWLVASLVVVLAAATAPGILRMRGSNEALGSLYNERVVALEQLKGIADAHGNGVVDTARKVASGSLDAARGAVEVKAAQAGVTRLWAT